MIYLFFGIFGSFFFTMVILLTLNYAIIIWHNDRLTQNLQRKQNLNNPSQANSNKQQKLSNPENKNSNINDNINNKYTGFNKNALLNQKQLKYPNWINHIILEFYDFRKNGFSYLKKLFKNLVSNLRQDKSQSRFNKNNNQPQNQDSFFEETLMDTEKDGFDKDYVKDPSKKQFSNNYQKYQNRSKSVFTKTNHKKSEPSKGVNYDDYSDIEKQNLFPQDFRQGGLGKSKLDQTKNRQQKTLEKDFFIKDDMNSYDESEEKNATIDLLSQNSNKIFEDNQANSGDTKDVNDSKFSEKESLILSQIGTKLEERKIKGLTENEEIWHLWMSLGNLYAKAEKAKEAKAVYSMILGNTNDNNLKQEVTNKLIGLA